MAQPSSSFSTIERYHSDPAFRRCIISAQEREVGRRNAERDAEVVARYPVPSEDEPGFVEICRERLGSYTRTSRDYDLLMGANLSDEELDRILGGRPS